jgi:predicted RNase H-like HicB family nuclease
MSRTNKPNDIEPIDLENIEEIALTLEQEAQLAKILRRPYHREVSIGEDGRWYATVAEWSVCMGDGATAADAIADLDDAMEVWAASCISSDTPIPEAIRESEYSAAVRIAKIEGLSLNNFLSIAIARAVGQGPIPPS